MESVIPLGGSNFKKERKRKMNAPKHTLTAESQDFLDNLRLYLFSSGKKDDEINEIVEELEDHLMEAEKRGKSVQHIVGSSPKVYMEQLSEEMSFDFKWLSYFPVIVLGVFAYVLLGDAIRGGVQYSLLQVIGYPVACLLLTLLYLKTFKFLASRELSKVKNGVIFFLLGSLPIAFFLGLLLANKAYKTPSVIDLGTTGNIVATILAAGIFIGIALWSKTWFTIVIPLMLFVPEFLIGLTSLEKETKGIMTLSIMVVVFATYFAFTVKKSKETL
ncbi:hypothetical protein QUF49_02335 [Fictibacillus sp. b24]|uniref:HAAS domain-containing protein n=1 Tax=Fictibacillus sp. b24 TaxID=3055863 RepID=UPI0025A16A43|nr:hypothetical protein [Fictibacillus sp. b24]MDM5314812.1 hypothetical protein [Fictibacillus sp. b24]